MKFFTKVRRRKFAIEEEEECFEMLMMIVWPSRGDELARFFFGRYISGGRHLSKYLCRSLSLFAYPFYDTDRGLRGIATEC